MFGRWPGQVWKAANVMHAARDAHPTNFGTPEQARLLSNTTTLLSRDSLVGYYIDYCETFGYHNFLGGRVVRPVDALVCEGGEGALWATSRLPQHHHHDSLLLLTEVSMRPCS